MSKYLGVRISDDLHDLLDNISQSTNKPKAFHIKKALESYLEELVDHHDAITIMQHSKGSYSLDEVKKRLGLSS